MVRLVANGAAGDGAHRDAENETTTVSLQIRLNGSRANREMTTPSLSLSSLCRACTNWTVAGLLSEYRSQ
jgi:hypothetical protein